MLISMARLFGNKKSIAIAVLTLSAVMLCADVATAQTVISPVPASIVSTYNLDTRWYKKYVDAWGLPILGSATISNQALLMARDMLSTELFTTPYFAVASFNRYKIRVVLVARTERMSSIPEVYAAYGTSLDSRYWGGMGATPSLPVTVGTEANIIDNFGSENVFVHEFGHTLMNLGLSLIDPNFTPELMAAWSNANQKQLWKNTYAMANIEEYWAEGIQVYFNVNREGPPGGDGVHNNNNIRAELATYDVPLYNLFQRIYKGATLPKVADYSLNASPSTLPVVRGAQGSATLNVATLNGYTGRINLVASGVPAGMTVVVTPTYLTSSGAATIKFTVSSSVTPGSYWIGFYGQSAREHFTGVYLTVTR